MDFPSFQDLFNVARDEALYRNAQLTQDAVDRDGSDANILVASSAAAADEVMTQLAKAAAALFLSSAAGGDLDKLAYDRYQLLRKPASPSVGQVALTTATLNPSPFSIVAGTQFSTASGMVFVSTDPVVIFPSGTSGPVYVNVQSSLAGASQQAAIGTITSVVTPIPGAPSNLVVTNPLATAGASDEETPDSLRSRAQQFFTTARRGTISALVQGALAVPGVTSAQAFESVGGSNVPSGSVELVVTDSYTDALAQLSTVPPSYQVQAQTLAVTVFAGLYEVRAAGINVQVTVAQVTLQSIQLALTFPAGVDTADIAAQAKAVAVAYTNALTPGETFLRADLAEALRGVSGLIHTGNEVVLPVGDVVPNPLQVIRTTPSLVTTYVP